MKESERVRVLRENFMDLRKSGLSMKDIAQKNKLSVQTVYAQLDEIAATAGTTREALLYQPQKKHEYPNGRGKKKHVVEPEKVRQNFNELFDMMDSIKIQMQEVMEE